MSERRRRSERARSAARRPAWLHKRHRFSEMPPKRGSADRCGFLRRGRFRALGLRAAAGPAAERSAIVRRTPRARVPVMLAGIGLEVASALSLTHKNNACRTY